MNALAYLVTLSNLQAFRNSAGPLKDLAIKMGPVQTLEDELKALPEFNLQDFRDTGFYKVGYVGKYLSKNLREYIYNRSGNPYDEGVVLTLYYKDNLPARVINDDDRTLSFLLHRDGISDDVKQTVQSFLSNKYARSKRSDLDIIKS